MEYNQELKGKGHFPVLCWGHRHLPKQKGQITYRIAPNQHRSLLHFWTGSLWNVVRRTGDQVLYFAPPLIMAYLAMDWANKRNEYLNSKAGRAELGEDG
ncbi:Cytochrome b-c1 complex subunit 8 [Pseudocercospora fuligena]|uniref:Cytochrome b-c1 complex subunit 8 n=1 Tax=Pseudocercospora fuligena TaxID=685502 RepID=A0A8H6RDS4_9PEZI|nr:Cytochrome b-c1 complex subunit 8 [Pseudocercospora fuligena]